jgi:hypothetical protein
MKPSLNRLLLPFYFGTIEERNRLLVERELLSDSEMLIDYLDLKRTIESAEPIPTLSPKVWYQLKDRVKDRKKVLLPFSIGMAFVMILLIFSMVHLKNENREAKTSIENEILFDSNSELPASSSVL